jgi:hypothetical protein
MNYRTLHELQRALSRKLEQLKGRFAPRAPAEAVGSDHRAHTTHSRHSLVEHFSENRKVEKALEFVAARLLEKIADAKGERVCKYRR